ncbi:hypothetical protein CQY20_09000 [Mycolicibacterium agri]|uniref:DUF2613 domain-containing protein n=1 Tax=Mycolicibacterium agri TaxID=36811 RepID=A0A2A7N980_MYCAG|nr:hypothetical protein [Mycolicibacterium agri]PEG40011.1 hypothetical protein CQY20_09000 [Mycolicibacterium agri]GFG51525.1 hypothetical protein MAGR_29660 [Mycolicibacterium agri]
MISQKLKVVSAAVGASAVVAMGALTVALSSGDSGSTTFVSDPHMTMGETSTVEKAGTEVETSVAVPEHTAEPPDGFGP